MSKPTPAHHKTLTIDAGKVADTYGGARRFRELPQHLRLKWWIIVAAAPVDAENPVPTGKVRVIVAPARVAP